MNILQGIQSTTQFCVTLNEDIEDRQKVLGEYVYEHPQFTLEAERAKQKWREVCSGNIWFCGAYWFNGFHEDGVNSALRVVENLR